MSGHSRKAQQKLKKINICNDIWLETFHWVGHAKVGQELAPLSDHFDVLVDEHFRTRKWTLGHLTIRRDWNNNGAMICTEHGTPNEQLPLPDGQLPRAIVGFQQITIAYIDPSVIAFLRRIDRLFKADITVEFSSFLLQSDRSWAYFGAEIWPLFYAGIDKMNVGTDNIAYLRTHIASTVLRDCARLRSINAFSTLPEFPAKDIDGASEDQALCKWLHTPRNDGRPKVLKLYYPATFDWVNQLIGTFRNATASVSFIIVILCADFEEQQPFELDSLYTHERLLARRSNDDDNLWLIERAPIGTDVPKWNEWEREAMDLCRNRFLFINVADGDLREV